MRHYVIYHYEALVTLDRQRVNASQGQIKSIDVFLLFYSIAEGQVQSQTYISWYFTCRKQYPLGINENLYLIK